MRPKANFRPTTGHRQPEGVPKDLLNHIRSHNNVCSRPFITSWCVYTAYAIRNILYTKCMFVVVNFDALAQASDFRIRKETRLLLLLNAGFEPGSLEPNLQQTLRPLTYIMGRKWIGLNKHRPGLGQTLVFPLLLPTRYKSETSVGNTESNSVCPCLFISHQYLNQAPLLSNRISVIHGSRINYETICCPQFCTYSYQILCHVGGTSPPTWHKIW